MEDNNGWIHLFRKFIDWEWYDCPNVKIVFLHCLLMANHKTGKWQGVTIKRGQFISSYEKIATANGLSVQQVRTSIKKLKMTHEINTQTTNLYTLITVNNYDLYQDTLTNKQQSNNNQITTNKNEKNNNSINTSINISSSSSIEEFEKFYKNLEEEEEETLKIFSKKEKIKCFRPWLRKIYNNGDYEEVKKQAYEYKYRLEAAQKIKEEQKLELEQQKQQERELTEEERKIFLQKAREKAGINKLRRAKK